MSQEPLLGTLAEIADVDPSRHGHTGPDTPEITARYARRNDLVWQALAQARDAGFPSGVGFDPADQERPVVVYLELPTGQVSWHLPDDGRHHNLPTYGGSWDGHTTQEKYRRVESFLGVERMRATLTALLAEQGTVAELAYVLGVIRGIAIPGQGGSTTATGPLSESAALTQIRQVIGVHQEVTYAGEHGAFALCGDDCRRCGEAVVAAEHGWQAALATQGIHLVDVATLPPEERAEHDQDEEYAVMAAEHHAAADPDPNFGRDGVW